MVGEQISIDSGQQVDGHGHGRTASLGQPPRTTPPRLDFHRGWHCSAPAPAHQPQGPLRRAPNVAGPRTAPGPDSR